MALIDSVLNMVNKKAKDPDAPKPPAGSRSEREAKIKDKAGLVINVFALLLALNAWYGGKLSSTVMNNTISANNQWAWYQAKNGRGVSYELAAVQTNNPQLKAKFEAEKARMDDDKKEIMEVVYSLAKQGQRVLGVAKSEFQKSDLPQSPLEYKFKFLGFKPIKITFGLSDIN